MPYLLRPNFCKCLLTQTPIASDGSDLLSGYRWAVPLLFTTFLQRQYKSTSCLGPLGLWYLVLAQAIFNVIISPTQAFSHHYVCAIRMLRLCCYFEILERDAKGLVWIPFVLGRCFRVAIACFATSGRWGRGLTVDAIRILWHRIQFFQ